MLGNVLGSGSMHVASVWAMCESVDKAKHAGDPRILEVSGMWNVCFRQ
jgi:hypothetical protein